MIVKDQYKAIVKRYDDLFNSLALEHLTVTGSLSELADKPSFYGVEDGVTIKWLAKEVEYRLSTYYEYGHCNQDLKEEDPKAWRSEVGKLKRLLTTLSKMDNDIVTEV